MWFGPNNQWCGLGLRNSTEELGIGFCFSGYYLRPLKIHLSVCDASKMAYVLCIFWSLELASWMASSQAINVSVRVSVGIVRNSDIACSTSAKVWVWS